MVIALLTADNRQVFRDYGNPTPYFGTAPRGLLFGLAQLKGENGDLKPEGGDLEAEDVKRKAESGNLKPERNQSHQFSSLNSQVSLPPQVSSLSSQVSVLPQVSPFEIHVISCTQRPMESPEQLADNIWFHSLHVPKWGWLRSGYLGCILAVRKKLREIQPDLVHAQGTERDCAISAIFTPYPKLLTIHGNLRLIRKTVKFHPFLLLQSFLEGFVVPRFDGVICITNYTKQAVQHEAKRTWLVPNAVDPAFLELGEERDKRKAESGNLKPEDGKPTPNSGPRPPTSDLPTPISNLPSSPPLPIVLVVANVDARKNQNAFIRAIDSLAVEKLFLVKFFGRCGEDGYGKEFQSLIAERPWCHYGGMLGRVELKEEFAKASILALPTHEDNCPMVVLEAQAAGIPVMASNVGGVPDLVENGATGLLTDPDRPETMRAALKGLLEDDELRATLSGNGFTQAQKRFHPSVVAARHLEIYRELIEGQRNG